MFIIQYSLCMYHVCVLWPCDSHLQVDDDVHVLWSCDSHLQVGDVLYFGHVTVTCT